MRCEKCNAEIPDDSVYCPHCGNMIGKPTAKKKTFKAPSLKSLLAIIALGIWMIALQNLGVIPVTQNVHVKNRVPVEGNVDVDNTVDVNLQYINGHEDVFFNNPRRGEKDKYYVLPVTVE